MLVLRSSIGIKYDVVLCNQVGIIDNDYYDCPENEGHIWAVLRNDGNAKFEMRKGEAFCQCIFMKCLTAGEKVETKREGWSAADATQKIKK